MSGKGKRQAWQVHSVPSDTKAEVYPENNNHTVIKIHILGWGT